MFSLLKEHEQKEEYFARIVRKRETVLLKFQEKKNKTQMTVKELLDKMNAYSIEQFPTLLFIK